MESSIRKTLNKPERNAYIDVLRAFAAYLVVVIHFSQWTAGHHFTDLFSQVVMAEVRVAVPLFLMTTGFYYDKLVASGRFRWHLIKLLVMALLSTLLYLTYSIAIEWHLGTLGELVAQEFRPVDWLSWIVCNKVPSVPHLWYFYAVLYALCLMRLSDHYGNNRIPYIVAAVLYILLSVSNFLPFIPEYFTRNFLFLAFPYMMLGRLVAKHQARQTSRLDNRRSTLVSICIGSSILVALEALVHSYFISPDNPIRDNYFFTLPTATALFLLVLSIHSKPGRTIAGVAHIGFKYSAYIYIFHIIVGHRVFGLLHSRGYNSVYVALLLGIPVVYVLTILLSACYVKWLKPLVDKLCLQPLVKEK